MGGRTGDLDPITTCVGSTNGTKYQGNLVLFHKRMFIANFKKERGDLSK